jgi:hypothetical protein
MRNIIKLPVQIKIEAYKPSGKYYSDYYLVAPVTHLYDEEKERPVTHYMQDAIDAVEKAIANKELPSEFHLRITTDSGYPVLIPLQSETKVHQVINF